MDDFWIFDDEELDAAQDDMCSEYASDPSESTDSLFIGETFQWLREHNMPMILDEWEEAEKKRKAAQKESHDPWSLHEPRLSSLRDLYEVRLPDAFGYDQDNESNEKL